jgi:hypothetical protein
MRADARDCVCGRGCRLLLSCAAARRWDGCLVVPARQRGFLKVQQTPLNTVIPPNSVQLKHFLLLV